MQQGHAATCCCQVQGTGVRRRSNPNLCRCSTAHADSRPDITPEAMQLPRQRLRQLFSGESPALLLERSMGARSGTDAALWNAVPFAGQILPDLPVAGSWTGLLQAALQR